MIVTRGLGTTKALLSTSGLGLFGSTVLSVLCSLPVSWELLTAAERAVATEWSLLARADREAPLTWKMGGYVLSPAEFDWSVYGTVWHTPHLTLRVANEIRRMLVVK